MTHYGALSTKARECAPAEVRRLLNDFGGDEKAVAAIERGVHAHYNSEDSGSYCENASAGYADAARKEKILVDFHTASNGFRKLKPADKPEDKLAQIVNLLQDLGARVEKLERKGRGPRP